MGLRNKILATKPKLEPVTVCGEDVYLRAVSGERRNQLIAEMFNNKKAGLSDGFELVSIRSKIVMASLCDEDGTRVFEDGDLEKFDEAICAEPIAQLEDLFLKALRVNYLAQESKESAEKN